jgi:uncharacterized protein (TIGR02172 family)
MRKDLKIDEYRGPDSFRLRLEGSLDQATAPLVRERLPTAATGALEIDLAACSYISSAGLRLLLEIHKAFQFSGNLFRLLNVSPFIENILETTGLAQLLSFTRARREIFLQDREMMAAGTCGECYRLDEESVVKLYYAGISADLVEREKQFAREAFILGIPTAISYEIVQCGDRLGVVYEMLEAKLFSEVIRNDLQNLESHAQTLAAAARTIHSARDSKSLFPQAKTHFRRILEQLADEFSAEDIEHLRYRLDQIPDTDECVHLDLHTSNIMIREGQPLIIDMGEFSVGSFLFDLGQWCTIYGYPELNTCEIVTQIPSDRGRVFLENLLDAYFTDRSQEERAIFEANRHFLASLRTMGAACMVPALREPLVKQVREFMMPRIRAEWAAAGASSDPTPTSPGRHQRSPHVSH